MAKNCHFLTENGRFFMFFTVSARFITDRICFCFLSYLYLEKKDSLMYFEHPGRSRPSLALNGKMLAIAKSRDSLAGAIIRIFPQDQTKWKRLIDSAFFDETNECLSLTAMRCRSSCFFLIWLCRPYSSKVGLSIIKLPYLTHIKAKS